MRSSFVSLYTSEDVACLVEDAVQKLVMSFKGTHVRPQRQFYIYKDATGPLLCLGPSRNLMVRNVTNFDAYDGSFRG